MTSEPAARAAERIVNNMVVPVLPLDKQTAGFRKVQAAEYAAIIRDEFAATLAAKDAEIASLRAEVERLRADAHPDSEPEKEPNRCMGCGYPVADHCDYCGECLCEEDGL